MIHIIIGTKAQLIKMAPVMLKMQNEGLQYNFIFTGQHKETIDDLRENFSLKLPDTILHDGKDIVSYHSMLIWIFKILFKTFLFKRTIFKQDKRGQGIVLVHGDTFSTLLGAIIGKVAGFSVAHIESGLRSFNFWHPFPEELTRLLTFNLSSIYFCPGQWAIENLKKYKGKKINTQYNTLLDSLSYALKETSHNISIPKEDYCIVTIHRFENLFSRSRLETNISLIEQVSQKIKVVFILHPITERKLILFNLKDRLESNKKIEIHPRYDYFNFIHLVDRSQFVISDGGSNQEECYYMGKPCLLLRKATERKEGLNENVVISHYKPTVFAEFVNDYKRYNTGPIVSKDAPSDIIFDYLSRKVQLLGC